MMPHVDDGTLHALLDGALRAERPDRAAEVESHLESCADCRARLEATGAVRDDAQRILDDAAPPTAPALPDFAEVLARAGRDRADVGAGDPSSADPDGIARQLRWTRGLAWAATIVVALGTGYLIRDLGGPAVLGSDDRAAPTGAGVPEAGSPEVQFIAPPPAEGDRTQGRSDARPPDPETGPLTAPATPRAEAPAAETAMPTEAPRAAGPTGPIGDVAREPAAGAAAAPTPAEPRVDEDRAVARQRAEAEKAVEAEALDAAELSLVPTASVSQGAAFFARPQEGRWVAATPVEGAEALGGTLYVLPRAELVEVYRATGSGVAEVLTRQRLSSGITIRVLQRPASEAPEAASEAPATASSQSPDSASHDPALPGPATVIVRRDGHILEISGSLPAELLTILGEGARPAN